MEKEFFCVLIEISVINCHKVSISCVFFSHFLRSVRRKKLVQSKDLHGLPLFRPTSRIPTTPKVQFCVKVSIRPGRAR